MEVLPHLRNTKDETEPKARKQHYYPGIFLPALFSLTSFFHSASFHSASCHSSFVIPAGDLSYNTMQKQLRKDPVTALPDDKE